MFITFSIAPPPFNDLNQIHFLIHKYGSKQIINLLVNLHLKCRKYTNTEEPYCQRDLYLHQPFWF